MKVQKSKIILTIAMTAIVVLTAVFAFSSCSDVHVHTFQEIVEKEASCTDAGKSIKKCTDPTCDYLEELTILATGHTITHIDAKDSCTGGYDAHDRCTKCKWTTLTASGVRAPTDHKTVHVDDRTNKIHDYKLLAPTCTESGYHYEYDKCTMCNERFNVVEVFDAALGHDVCNVAARAATCTEVGNNAYSYCKRCREYFVQKETYDAIGHLIEYQDAKDPTCTEAGWYQYAVCMRDDCGYDTKEACARPALGHSVTTDEVIVAPGCTTEGTYASKTYCTTCNKEFATEFNVTDAPLGHNYLADGYCERYSVCGDRISVGLAYYQNADGTYTVSGRGSCTDADIIIPDEYNGFKIVAIAEKAFIEDYAMTSIKLSDNITEIGDKAFFLCQNLKTVTIGASVTKIGASAFRFCTSIVKTYYTGSNWGAIYIDSLNEDLTSKY